MSTLLGALILSVSIPFCVIGDQDTKNDVKDQRENVENPRDNPSVEDAIALPTTGANFYRDSAWYDDQKLQDIAVHTPYQRTLDGQWELAWDDQITKSLDENPHKCTIRLKEIDGFIGGEFIGPVAGRERDEIISGRVEDAGGSRILVFQQRESGYVCSYQAIDNGGAIYGVWHDTKNRSGNFRLLKHQ